MAETRIRPTSNGLNIKKSQAMVGAFQSASQHRGVLIFLSFYFCLVLATAPIPAFSQSADEITSMLAQRMCPSAKIDESGLPDYAQCKALEPHWVEVDQCQTKADHYFKLVGKLNQFYDQCHQGDESSNDFRPSQPKASGSASGTGVSGSHSSDQGATEVLPQTDYAAAERAHQRSEFDLAQKMDSLEGWRAFLKEYPDGVDAAWAKKRIAELSEGSSSGRRGGRMPVENGGAPAFHGKIGVNLTISIDQRAKHYFDSRMNQVVPSHRDSTHMSVQLDVGAGNMSYRESGNPTVYNCGQNRQLQTNWSPPGTTELATARCSYSLQGDTLVLNMLANLNLSNGRSSQFGTITKRLVLSVKDGLCAVSQYVSGMNSNGTGFIHIDIERHDTLVSGECTIE